MSILVGADGIVHVPVGDDIVQRVFLFTTLDGTGYDGATGRYFPWQGILSVNKRGLDETDAAQTGIVLDGNQADILEVE